MSENDEQRFQSSNKCWICDKLFDVGDNKVIDHWINSNLNINLKLTKKVPVIFYN